MVDILLIPKTTEKMNGSAFWQKLRNKPARKAKERKNAHKLNLVTQKRRLVEMISSETIWLTRL